MRNVTRRQAVVAMGAVGAGACVCGLGEGCATFTKKGKTPPLAAEAYEVRQGAVRIALDKVPALRQAGGAVKIIDARLPDSLIVARTGEHDFAVASLLCPHRGVEVEYRHGKRQFRCASLGHSTFGEDGSLKKGLARKGLTRFVAKVDPADMNRLVITF